MTTLRRANVAGCATGVLVAALLLAACSAGNRDDQPAASAPAGQGFDSADSVETVDATLFAATGGGATLSGRVVDTAGAPVGGVALALCGTACWPAVTGADGTFTYRDVPAEHYALDVRGDLVVGRRLTSVVFPVTVAAGSQELQAPVRLHNSPPAQILAWDGAGPLTVGALTLQPDAPLDLGLLEELTGHASIGAVAMPPAAWPRYRLTHDGVTYRPLSMWALSPFAHTLPTALTVHAGPAGAPAAPAAELAIFTVDVVTGTPQWLGTARPTPAAPLAAESGLRTLTWLILAAPQS